MLKAVHQCGPTEMTELLQSKYIFQSRFTLLKTWGREIKNTTCVWSWMCMELRRTLRLPANQSCAAKLCFYHQTSCASRQVPNRTEAKRMLLHNKSHLYTQTPVRKVGSFVQLIRGQILDAKYDQFVLVDCRCGWWRRPSHPSKRGLLWDWRWGQATFVLKKLGASAFHTEGSCGGMSTSMKTIALLRPFNLARLSEILGLHQNGKSRLTTNALMVRVLQQIAEYLSIQLFLHSQKHLGEPRSTRFW